MTDIVLDKITSGYNLSKINNNFEKVEDVINDEVLHLTGGNNVMKQDLDLNGHALLNIGSNPGEGSSLLTVEVADARYYNITGDKLEGDMDVDGKVVYNLPVASLPTSPVRKVEFDVESAARKLVEANEAIARQTADAALQAQITGGSTTASQFSVISWHPQVVPNSVNIPSGVNAWSFGPTITVAAGQTVTIGSGSFWTIADGKQQ